ncbi:MAG: type II toxin-antitoxin system PemK/MazF family toxin [Deltaproteobacteria bacterium]|nr:type II toxin-antitoxin system PemK/MazF family toxin [Deltaproteobacteria bacterium]MBW1737065.1 type II toxin-antitoxin system PemK/MazF family toxin [Deltaproteobacteria bacterium]MBW1908971.1 type II toxin-antitoxin system PemK/MazF family toxin [Deltaproteobacteria bacterium]MBW2033876.1 type II toxin-antitoxin system PemK/MazF family toxin [Deltaproteobacteria bacterium]MBW2114386.1 type II toxin-antitoxin system PemK/MazF family toxin [Deltaproteobacteria bacterium]
MPYPRRGEVYLVRLSGHPKDTKARPALVVSLDVRNRLANDIIVVPMSTTLRPSPTHVELPEGEAGLDRTSTAKCEQITTLDKSFLIRGTFSGTISPAKMAEVEKAIQRAIGIAI